MAAQDQKKSDDYYRLSEEVRPTHYALKIKTDLEKLMFKGTAEIDLDVLTSTSSITFHAAPSLKITHAALFSDAMKTSSHQAASSVDRDEKLDRATATFEVGLQAGSKARFGACFEGVMDSSMMGYYKSSYEYEGKKGWYGLTQFEPTAARRAFPCWDEPAIKATFDITMISRTDTVSLANTSVVSSKPSDGAVSGTELLPGMASSGTGSGWIEITFETTPKISTYLVAWANGDFKSHETSCVSPLTGRKIPMKVYATPEHIHQAKFTLDTTAQVLPIYEKIFDVPYPLSKLDTLVASDFDAGAMENWGLITGRTSIYLYDEKQSGIAAKKRTVNCQSHEIAHQWFGNIVTMAWWDNLWLNEAFATLMGEVIIVEELYPEWRVHSEFINIHLRRALDLDAQRSSHPIEMPCPDPEMINQIFDAISYSKGASVLKMLANMIGEKTFLKGVSIYLKKHLYENSRTKNLWEGISEASGLDVAKIMANWTLKVGFPVVTVNETSDGLHVTQNRFLSTGDPKPEEDEVLWYIPLEIKTVGKDGKVNIDHKAVLETRETKIPLANASDSMWKLNAETAGVYRVRYSPERLAKLGDEAGKKNSAFSLNDRMGLVQDAVVLAKSGYGVTSGALNLLSKMGGETEHLVWAEIRAATTDIHSAWWEQPQRVRDGIDKFRRTLFAPIVAKVGFDPKPSDDSGTRELRTIGVATAAGAQDQATIDEIKRRFALVVDQNDESAIPGDLRQPIFAFAVKYGGSKEYEKMLELYRKPPTPQHRVAAMWALCAPQDKALLQKTLGFILSDEVKSQDMMYFFGGLGANRLSRRELWAWTQEHFDEVKKRLEGNFTLGRLLEYSFDGFTTEEDAAAVEEFFKTKDTSTFKQSLSQGLDRVRSKSAWLSRSTKDVEQWLEKNDYM